MEGHYGKWKGVTRAHCLMGRSLLWLWNHSWFLKSNIFKASFFVSGFSTAQLYHIHTIPPLESRGSCECWSLSATRTIHKHCKVMFIEEFVAASAGSFSFNVHFLYITLYSKAKKTQPQQNKKQTVVAETYQNNSSCRSNKGVQEPALQRQPTAAGKAEEKTQLTPTKALTSKLMVHTSIQLCFPQLSGEKCHML